MLLTNVRLLVEALGADFWGKFGFSLLGCVGSSFLVTQIAKVEHLDGFAVLCLYLRQAVAALVENRRQKFQVTG